MRRILVLLVALALIGGAAFAQEQAGAIEGVVNDNSGAALPGATVEAIGPFGTMVAVTGIDGGYRFPSLRSGVYKVTARLDGFVAAEVPQIDLQLGRTLRVSFTLQPGTFQDTITVSADTVAIDVTKTQTATSISREEIQFLPRGRDFTNVVSLAAGATDDQQAGGISIDGSSGAENRFVIDGIDTTDPQRGTSAVPMRADFIEEVQVKSAGYAAEYGGSTGGVINAITKSGGNSFHGALLGQYEARAWGGKERPTLQLNLNDPTVSEYQTFRRDDQTQIDPGFYVSGPLVKDTLWFYGSYQPDIAKTDRTVTFTNDDVTDTFAQKIQTDYVAANVTANFGSLLFKVGANFSPSTQDRALPVQSGRGISSSQSDYTFGVDNKRETYSASLDYVPTEKWVISGRVGYFHTNTHTTNAATPPAVANYYSGAGLASPALYPEVPAELRHPAAWRDYTINAALTQKDSYKRKSGSLDASWFFAAAGDHTLKFGVQTEEIDNDVLLGYDTGQHNYFWNRSYTTTSGESLRGTYGYFRLRLFQTQGAVKTRNDAIFMQDQWAIAKNLTINYGIRAEHERVPNYGPTGDKYAVDFKYGDKLAPRLGFAWDLFNDQKWKVYGSYGQYYDVMKSELPRSSFGGDKWVDYYFTFDNWDWRPDQNSATCTSGPNNLSWTPSCSAGTLIEMVDRRHNSADPNESYIDPSLKPTQTWEAQVGVEHQLTNNVKVGARYVHKAIVRAIEDTGILVPGIGEVYYIANPGEGLTTSIAERPFPKPVRDYDALEKLTLDRRFTENWSVRGSYTYSRLWGNYSGLANSDEHIGAAARISPNVSRLFDTVLNSYDRNGTFVYGNLGTDRPHQLKVQALYRFPFNLTVGVNEYVASGTPVSEEALVPINTPFFPNGRGNLGRTATLSQTDLALYQDVKLGGLNVQFGLNVMNLFDQDTETRRWDVRTTQDLPVSEEQFFAGGWDYEALLAQLAQNDGIDPRFNHSDVYQAPRAIRLSVKLEF